MPTLSSIQLAQSRLNLARQRSRMLGDKARANCEVYLDARRQWLDALEREWVIEKEVNEQLAIEMAFREREKRREQENQNGGS